MNDKEVLHFESLYPVGSRYEEVRQILDYVRQGQSCQAIGLPGVGQSTLLKLLSYNKNVRIEHLGSDVENYHFVLINFSEVRDKLLVDVTKFMFLSLVDSLRERGLRAEHEKIIKLFKEYTSLSDELVKFQGLKQALDFLTLEKNLTIVFLLDRFEEYIPNLTSKFFTNLRVFHDRAKHKFSVVVSLSRPIEDNIEPALMADFSEYIANHKVYIPIKEESVLEFRIRQIEELSGKILEPSHKEEILFQTGGFGRLTKNCVQAVLSQSINQDVALVDFLLAQSVVKTPLVDIWQSLTPSEQDFLLSNKSYEATDQDYPYLFKVGLLDNDKISIPIFEKYLREVLSLIEKKTENEPIVYLKEKKEIKKGDDLISDRLTASEFRLLRFLIENQNSIIDRESVISSVWSDSASTAGVTEQALDQLLLRLRKKIEDDPNNPVHIQTIKGRGIRFVP